MARRKGGNNKAVGGKADARIDVDFPKCKTCPGFVKGPQIGQGECHGAPPSAQFGHASGGGVLAMGAFPPVSAESFCLQHPDFYDDDEDGGALDVEPGISA